MTHIIIFTEKKFQLRLGLTHMVMNYYTHIKIFLWHYYTRRGLKKHWDDHNEWGGRNDGSHQRNRKLLSMDGEVYDLIFWYLWVRYGKNFR